MDNAAAIQLAVVNGDLGSLNPEQRVEYYKQVCDSLQLNYLTHPLDFYTGENNRVYLEINKEGAAQLRKIHSISIIGLTRDIVEGICVFTATGSIGNNGRVDSATGAVALQSLPADQKANAIMAAETKAKRRLTVSLAGSGLLGSDERETIPGALPGVIEKPAPQPVPTAIAPPAVEAGPAVEEKPAAVEVKTTNVPALPSAPVAISLPPAGGLFAAPKPAEAISTTTPAPTAPTAQPVQEAAAAPSLTAAPVAASAPTNVAAPDPKALHGFQTRASVLSRDVLGKAGMKDGGAQLKTYMLRVTGKKKLPELSAEEWETALTALEGKVSEGPEVVALLVNPSFKKA